MEPITTLVPKMEPKVEPSDEPLRTHHHHQPHPQTPPHHPFFFDFTPNMSPNSQPTPLSRLNQNTPQPSSTPSEEDNNGHSHRAIVPLPEHSQQPRKNQRSRTLVRAADLKPEGQTRFRELVSRTRMIYESLRISKTMERERRSDVTAGSLMKERGLWLNRDKRIVGSVPGVEVGDVFFYRMELSVLGLHGPPQAGIDYVPANQSGIREPIATSIVVSGGYEDNEDEGAVIVYTGQGGQNKASKQCANQRLEGGNLALERSKGYGNEVRVIRGIKCKGSFTGKVYVYDGLYRVVGSWFDVGKSGFGVWKYRLLRIEGQCEMGSAIFRLAERLRASPSIVRSIGYHSYDISMNKESVPVLLFNDVDFDQEPMCYEYIAKTVFPPFVFQQGNCDTGCDCVSGCTDSCFCAWKNGGKFCYDTNGILVRGKRMIFECGSHCHCPSNCQNRVTQNGLKHRLEVFRLRESIWGVRSLDLIQAGAFISEFTGVILTKEQAQIFAMNGNDNLVYPGQFSDKCAEWGDLSQMFSDYECPSYPSTPPLDFAMDVSTMRNVASYIRHSATPNVLVQFVLYDHNNVLFPHLMLFAMENIPPLRELTLGYGVADEWTEKLAICN